MEDIKLLYTAAKTSKTKQAVDAYTEQVQQLKNQPIDYLTNIEYIISSNLGLQTLREFVDTYGLSVSSYDTIMSYLEKGESLCKQKGIDGSSYTEAIDMMKSWKEQYPNNFLMYEAFEERIDNEYLPLYYKQMKLLESGNVKIINGFISKYGEAAIPDMIIATDRLGALNILIEGLSNSPAFSVFQNPTYYQWLTEACKDTLSKVDPTVTQQLYEKSLNGIYDRLQSVNENVLRESVLMGVDDYQVEYSEDDIKFIEDLISFKEYMITALDSEDDIKLLQEEVYALYEELAGVVDDIEEDTSETVLPVLPAAKNEGSLFSLSNKQTGSAPGYLKKNHDLGYGEDDVDDKPKREPKLDDFKRPSNKDSAPESSDDVSVDVIEDLKDDIKDAKTPEEKQQAINNYYYYTYNTKDSYNKTVNSNNKTTTSRSSTTNDSSVNKRINSDDISDTKAESAPWELNHPFDLLTERGDENFQYTYRVVKATDGNQYLVTFDIDGPEVVNYKLHYPDANKDTVKFVGRISGKYLRKYGNDNYVSKGNKIVSIKNIKTGKLVDSIIASGGVPADGEGIENIGVREQEYRVGGLSPLSYKTTIPIYPMLGDVKTPYGPMKGISANMASIPNLLNPFIKRRIDFSKPILYKDEYAHIGVILKDILLGYKLCISSYKSRGIQSIAQELNNKIRSHNLFGDYMIHPLDIDEFNNIILMSAIFVKNCANNITKEPWKSVINLYDGLLIGFLGPAIGGTSKYININIMENLNSDRYKVDTNLFQNISDWFTLLGNGIAQLIAVDKSKRQSYYDQHENVKVTIRDIFYNKNSHDIYESFELFEPCPDMIEYLESTTIYEGVGETLKKIGNSAKGIINRIKGFILLKRSLINLQRMDMPKNRRPIPLTLPGTNITIPISKNVKTESIEYSNEDVFSEKASNNLTRSDIKTIIKSLRSKLNANIIFISSSSIMGMTGTGACVISTTRDKLIKAVKKGGIDSINLDDPESMTRLKDVNNLYKEKDPSDEKFILINLSVIKDYNFKSADDVEKIILHEYGHVLTFDKISVDDWAEYTSKVQMLSGLMGTMMMFNEISGDEMQFYYWELKPEKLANDAVGLKPDDLFYIHYGKHRSGEIEKILNLKAFVDIKLPAVVMDSTKNAVISKSPSIDTVIEITNWTKEFYKKIVKHKELLNTLITGCDYLLSRYKSENNMFEAVGDADDNKPQSDNVIRDIGLDIDRNTAEVQQVVKKKVQDVTNAGRAVAKPVKRTQQWVTGMVNHWKDTNENNLKEKMADPHKRSTLYKAIRKCIIWGSLLKAHLLLNPIFLFLSLTKKISDRGKTFRLRNEMIGELKTEIQVIEEKIKDADRNNDTKAKYQLMRLKNEINKKLIRVGGSKKMAKAI